MTYNPRIVNLLTSSVIDTTGIGINVDSTKNNIIRTSGSTGEVNITKNGTLTLSGNVGMTNISNAAVDTSVLFMNGSYFNRSLTYYSSSSPFTVAVDIVRDYVIWADSNGDIYLPALTQNFDGAEITIKKRNIADINIIASGSDLIEAGAGTPNVLQLTANINTVIKLKGARSGSQGVWFIIGYSEYAFGGGQLPV